MLVRWVPAMGETCGGDEQSILGPLALGRFDLLNPHVSIYVSLVTHSLGDYLHRQPAGRTKETEVGS